METENAKNSGKAKAHCSQLFELNVESGGW